MTKTCQYLEFEPYYYKDGSPDGCLTVDFDADTCGDNVHLMAYSKKFDPDDLSAGYLGDIQGYGTSNDYFAFPYASQSLVYFVAQTNAGPTTCDFSFSIRWSKCA